MGRERDIASRTRTLVGLTFAVIALLLPALPAPAALDTEPFEEVRVLCIYKGEKVYWGATTEACKSSDLLIELPADGPVDLCLEGGEKIEYSSTGACASGQTLHTVPTDGLMVMCVKNRKYGQVDKKRADVFFHDDHHDCDPPKYYGNYVTPAPPVTGGDAYTIDEDSLLTVAAADGVLTNDADYITPVLTAQLVDDASVGTVALDADGGFTYDPRGLFDHLDTDETAEVTFTYAASDGELNSAPETVTITVTGVNDAPVGVPDLNPAYFVTDEDTVLETFPGAVRNDTDAEGHVLTAELIEWTWPGTLQLGSGLRFDPAGAYEALDTHESSTRHFIYRAFDGTDYSEPTIGQVNIRGVNDAPVANDDTATTDENTPIEIQLADLLVNDTDVDLENLTATDFSVASPSSSFDTTTAAQGYITFNPHPDFDALITGHTGQATIRYRASDGDAVSDPATLRITVHGISPSVANDDSADTYNDQQVTVDVLANDEVNGGSIVLLSQPDQGTASIQGNQILFDPAGDFDYLQTGGYAFTTFRYRLDNPDEGPSHDATVTVYVIGR